LETNLDFKKNFFGKCFKLPKKIKNQKFHNSQKIPLGDIYNMMCQSQRAAAPPHPYSTFGQTTIFRTIQDYLFSFSQARWKHETGIVKGLELANSKPPGPIIIDISNQSRSGVLRTGRNLLIANHLNQSLCLTNQSLNVTMTLQ
jgi:hypothetical protein